MKYRLLEILCCPACSGALALDVFRAEQAGAGEGTVPAPACRLWCPSLNRPRQDANAGSCNACYSVEVIEGRLSCRCGETYPIVDGIPRLLPKALLSESMTKYHTDFLARHRDQFPAIVSSRNEIRKKIDTMHAFGYQWTTFVANFDYFRSLFLSFVHPWLRPEDFAGKLVLEAGCGSGRPATVACSLGAEVVAVDLSEAVNTAYAMSKRHPGLHVVQGDIYALPVKPCFDLVYCVGVIQHLPDPAQAVRSIARTVPPGHRLVIWVYGIRELWYKPIDWLRGLTVRLPFRALHALSFVLAVLSEIFLLVPYRILSRLAPTRSVAERIPGRIYARFPFKENVLGWFDRLGAPVTHYFSRAEVERMLVNAGFENPRVAARPGASASWVAEATRLMTQ